MDNKKGPDPVKPVVTEKFHWDSHPPPKEVLSSKHELLKWLPFQVYLEFLPENKVSKFLKLNLVLKQLNWTNVQRSKFLKFKQMRFKNKNRTDSISPKIRTETEIDFREWSQMEFDSKWKEEPN